MMLYELFAVAAVGLGVALASATIWSRKNTWVRGAAVAGWVVLVPLVAGSTFLSLGHPAPWVQAVTVPGGEYRVLGVKMVQDIAIYVWLDFGKDHPRYFALPWDNTTADRLQGMLDAERNGEGGFAMDIPYEWSWDDNPPQFHPLPQPKMVPDKLPQQEEPRRYERQA
jgi:hypothetical protein